MSDFNAEVTSDDKLWAALAYALSPIVPIILMFMEDKKARPFIKANNAPALVLGIVNVIISSVLTAVIIGPCVGLAVWIYQLYLAYQSYQGKQVSIPFITDFCKNQGWS